MLVNDIVFNSAESGWARAFARIARAALESAHTAVYNGGAVTRVEHAPHGSYIISAAPVDVAGILLMDGAAGALVEVRAWGSAPRGTVASHIEAALYGAGYERVAAIALPGDIGVDAPDVVLYALIRA